MLDQLLGYLVDVARYLAVFVLTLVYPQHYTPWNARVVEIVRPDEVRVVRGPEVVNVRMYGVDSPLLVRNQHFGKEARAYTEKRLLGRVITVQPLPARVKGPWYKPRLFPVDDLRWDGNRNKYQRYMALVYVDGESFGEELLKKGMARWYSPFVPFERGYKHLEDEAKAAGRGLWHEKDTVPPWEYQKTPITEMNPWQRVQGLGNAILVVTIVAGIAFLIVAVYILVTVLKWLFRVRARRKLSEAPSRPRIRHV